MSAGKDNSIKRHLELMKKLGVMILVAVAIIQFLFPSYVEAAGIALYAFMALIGLFGIVHRRNMVKIWPTRPLASDPTGVAVLGFAWFAVGISMIIALITIRLR